MRAVELLLPDKIAIPDNDILMIVASKLYENGTLSTGQAAQLAGLTKRTFLELLGKYDVSVFSTSLDVLESDIANA